MKKIEKLDSFDKWLKKLKDIRARITISRRIDRLKDGNFGDFKGLGEGLLELRITVGAGYRVYLFEKNDRLIILLVGGDKSTQKKDILKAKKLKKELS